MDRILGLFAGIGLVGIFFVGLIALADAHPWLAGLACAAIAVFITRELIATGADDYDQDASESL